MIVIWIRFNYRTGRHPRAPCGSTTAPPIRSGGRRTGCCHPRPRTWTATPTGEPAPSPYSTAPGRQFRCPPSHDAETAAIAEWLKSRGQEGYAPYETGVFVRSKAELDRAIAATTSAATATSTSPHAVEGAGYSAVDLAQHAGGVSGNVAVGTMHLVVKDQLNNAEQRLAEEFCNCPALSHRLRDKLIRRVVEVHRLAAELHRLDRSAHGRGASGDRRTGQRRVADGHRTWPPPDSARRRPETQTELAPAELPVQQIAARSLEVLRATGQGPLPAHPSLSASRRAVHDQHQALVRTPGSSTARRCSDRAREPREYPVDSRRLIPKPGDGPSVTAALTLARS